MRNVILYTAISLDGYLADQEGTVNWISGENPQDDMPWYEPFYHSIDVILMGNTTYSQITTEISPDIWMYGDKKTYVFTHGDEGESKEISFTNRSPKDLIHYLKHRKGKDIWLCGGANLIAQCIAEDLVDEYHLTLIPVLLGGGLPLFPSQNGQSGVKQPLTLISQEHSGGMVDLVYRKRST